jgi:hypothetical protein
MPLANRAGHGTKSYAEYASLIRLVWPFAVSGTTQLPILDSWRRVSSDIQSTSDISVVKDFVPNELRLYSPEYRQVVSSHIRVQHI